MLPHQRFLREFRAWRLLVLGVLLLLVGLSCWNTTNRRGHTVFLILTPACFVLSFINWRRASRQPGQRPMRRTTASAQEPAKSNPLADLPPLRK